MCKVVPETVEHIIAGYDTGRVPGSGSNWTNPPNVIEHTRAKKTSKSTWIEWWKHISQQKRVM